jgi:hypothetical protein
MADDPDKPQATSDPVILRLVKETGITEVEAREIVALLGVVNWSSLVREARLLKPKR